jgi:acetyl esterase/lipase
VWIHGEALINGRRERINGNMQAVLLEHGYAIVSIDYRLAPETQLPEIVADVVDAVAWIRDEGRTRLDLDTRRIAIAGSSAGGYLTLAAGHLVQPRPAVLVSICGYGDLVGAWYSTPSSHPRHHRITLSAEAAWQQVGGPPIANSSQREGDGGAFYQFCRQNGIWPQAVSGWDPQQEADMFAPYMPLRNVSDTYPPTLLIHGTDDTDVPYEQATLMAEQLERHAVCARPPERRMGSVCTAHRCAAHRGNRSRGPRTAHRRARIRAGSDDRTEPPRTRAAGSPFRAWHSATCRRGEWRPRG